MDESVVFSTNIPSSFVLNATDANGNVGIATTAPSVPLEVAGSVRLATSGGTTVIIGNVRADGKLQVDGTIRADGYRTADGTSGVPSYRFVNSASTGMFSPSANQLALATSGSERLHTDASGNVGIGRQARPHGWM